MRQNKGTFSYILINIIATVLYVLEYKYVYENFVIGQYAYSNLTYNPVGNTFLLVLVCTLPILLYKGLNNISTSLSFFIYLFVYIPLVVTCFLADFPVETRVSIVLVFLVVMFFVFLTDKYSIGRHLFSLNNKPWSFRAFETLVWFLFVIDVFINRGSLTFVNFLSEGNDLYDLRLSQGVEGLGRVFVYLTLWLSHAFIPILFVCYYIEKKYIKLAFSFIAFVIMFMLDKQKITFVVPFAMIGMLVLIDRFKAYFTKYFHILVMSLLALSSIFTYEYTQKADNAFVSQSLAILVIIRTQCIAGEQLDRYVRFFEVEDNPYTYYSHINVVNDITGMYPYKESIGQVVAGDGSNSNASFFLMDGIAAAGNIGVILITVLFVLLKMLLNSISRRYNSSYLMVILFFAIFSMVNTSLFTSILSFGILAVFISLLLFKFPMLEK